MAELSRDLPLRRRVGLVYDEKMCGHKDPEDRDHPERPERIQRIMKKLQAEGIAQRCVSVSAVNAKDDIIASVHAPKYIKLIKSISSKKYGQRSEFAKHYNSIYFNEGSTQAAYLAAGSVVEVSNRVAEGNLDSAIAIVRPPGHHAEHDAAMGFCLFNNVAIAAKFLLSKADLGIKKILIVDWDVHHGNGTQNMFYKDPRVLFFSVHRFDSGSFYPPGGDGAHFMTGDEEGAGFNINVPWNHGQCGDADYIAVWDHVLIPVAKAYDPDMLLISAGFDAAAGDPLGGCNITPYGYSLMLKKLMRFAEGKIVMTLEGGYNLDSIANSVLACAQTLLDENPIGGSLELLPFESTWNVIKEVRRELENYWPALAVELPQEVVANSRKFSASELYESDSSDSEVANDDGASTTIYSFVAIEDVIQPFSMMNVNEDTGGISNTSTHLSSRGSAQTQSEKSHNDQTIIPDPIVNTGISWRSLLSKTEVWYGSYGSNMWKQRFLCYIQGGKADGMNEPSPGSFDKKMPKDVTWKIIPHRIFFGRSHSKTWGAGGVSFLYPESNIHEKTYMCMYKITLEQFNDVLLQENHTSQQIGYPLLGLSDLDLVAHDKSMPLEDIKDGWYSNVLHLGMQDNIPILTMTCTFSEAEHFKSGKLPLCAPSESYMNTLVKGLVEGKQLGNTEAIDYINNASSRKL